MAVLGRIVLDPSSLAAWLIVGAVCAWLASKMMADASYGMRGDLVFGALGAFAGGCIWGFLVAGDPAFWSTVFVALMGACLLISVARAIAAVRRA